MTVFKGIYRPDPPRSMDYNILWKGHISFKAKGVCQYGESYYTNSGSCNNIRKYWRLAIPEEFL